MANKERGDVAIMLDGKEYTLRPSMEAIAEIEADLDLGIFGVAYRIRNRQAGLRDIQSIVLRGIKAAGEKPPTDLPKTLGKEGLGKLLTPISLFVGNAISGGQAGDGDEDQGEE